MRRTGHIRERSPGAFELRYTLGTDPGTGKRKMATATVRGSRKEADKELRRLLRALDTGDTIEPGKLLARDWFQRWLKMARPEISPLTRTCETATISLSATAIATWLWSPSHWFDTTRAFPPPVEPVRRRYRAPRDAAPATPGGPDGRHRTEKPLDASTPAYNNVALDWRRSGAGQ